MSISLATAQQSCTSIQLSKSTYLAGELFQAEITGSLQKSIVTDDITFKFNGQEYSPAFGFEQAAKDKWLVWMNAPKDLGENSITVKALCKSDILKEESTTIVFNIQRPIQDAYNSLAFQVDNKWSSLSNDDLPLALSALSYNQIMLTDAKSELLLRESLEGCWPKNGCNVKTTALSADALKGLSNLNKSKNWLLDSENNVKIGLWDLVLTSNSAQTCNVTINNQSQSINLISGISNLIPLDLPNDAGIVVSTNCQVSNSKISHTYLGSVHDFAMSKEGEIASVTINNNKCWGTAYRSVCDTTSTAYALLTLTNMGETSLLNELNWLNQNLITTEQRAIYHLLTKDSDNEQWLTNNQASDGYWAITALAISTTPDVQSTVQAIMSLSSINAAKGEQWLRSIFESTGNFGTVKESGYAFKVFSSDKIEPIITSKGLFKVSGGKNVSIKFLNNGILAVNLTASLGSSSLQVNIPASLEKEIVLLAPSASDITFSYADITYTTDLGNQRNYKLPIIVLPSSVNENQFLDVISGTSSDGTSLLPSELSFSQSLSNITLQKSKKTSTKIIIKNISPKTGNVSITIFGLYDILSGIEPSSFELGPNKSKEVIIYFDTENAFGTYSGTINAESGGATASLPISITISALASDKTCSELSGVVCSTGSSCESNEVAAKDGSCCMTTCNKSTITKGTDYKKIAGWSMLVLAVLIGASFLYFKLKKKPQSALKIALEKIGKNPRDVLAN